MTHDELTDRLAYNGDTGVFTWRVSPTPVVKAGSKSGAINSRGYIVIQFMGRSYQSHRLAWFYIYGKWPTGVVDHIDGDKTNNAIANLRDVSVSTNTQNQKKAMSTNKCGLLGVSWAKKQSRWVAQILAAEGKKHLGFFDTPELAHQAYLVAKRQLHEGCTI